MAAKVPAKESTSLPRLDQDTRAGVALVEGLILEGKSPSLEVEGAAACTEKPVLSTTIGPVQQIDPPPGLQEDIPGGGRPLYLDEGPGTVPGEARSPFAGQATLRQRSLSGQAAKMPADTGSQVRQIRSSRRCITVASVAAGVFTVACVYWLVKAAFIRPPPHSNTCSTFPCQEYARRLRATVNRSVNPCQSFTRFVCDGWRRDNHHSVWEDQFKLVLKKLDTALHDIQWPRTGQNVEERAAAVYQSCDDVLKGKRDELPAVKAVLAEARIIWPQRSRGADVLYTLLHCSLKLGWDTLLHVNVDAISEKNVTLVVSPGRSILTLLELYDRHHQSAAERKGYFDIIRNAFGQTENTSNIDVVTYNATANYDNIAMPRLRRFRNEVPEGGPLADILAYATDIDIAEVHWMETLHKLNVSQSANPPLLWTTHWNYLQEIVSVWMDLGNDSFHVFVSWCTVQVAALYSNENLIFNFYDFNQLAVDLYHAAFCVNAAAYFSRDATFAKYNRDVLKRGSEDAARRLALSVRSACFRRLSTWDHIDEKVPVIANWSSLATVFRSFDYGKSKKTASKEPFPDMTESFVSNWKHSVLVEYTREVENLLFAIAARFFYISSESDMDFQLMPYSLSYPLFDFELPRAVNYGGFGSLVGSAVSERLLTSYWIHNASLIQPFLDCMHRGRFGNVSRIDAYANGALILGSVVDAYKEGMDFLDTPVEGFEEYSGLQTLFMSYCYIQCRAHSDPDGEGVCDLPLQYVPEFAEAFKCQSGEPMFPSRQCRLF
ncbi:membrane metallo-endopeptidase-like 1 [Haemaphysalis longicornis]